MLLAAYSDRFLIVSIVFLDREMKLYALTLTKTMMPLANLSRRTTTLV